MKDIKINYKNIRYFNKIELVDNNKNIIKSYVGDNDSFKKKFSNEIIWMLKAQKSIPKNVPKIIDYSLQINDLWIKYEMINNKTVHDIFLDKKNKFNNNTYWNEFAFESKELFKKLKKIKPSFYIKEEWKNNILNFSVKRQLEIIKKMSNNEEFKLFYNKDYVVINNKSYPSLSKIQIYLENKINELETNNINNEKDIFILLITPNEDRICFSHLDLVFGNIFFDLESKDIKMIDPRGSYFNNNDYGDIYYDYAKYFQSIYGLYDFIAEDKFSVEINRKDSQVTYKIEKPKNLNLIKKSFDIFFADVNIDVIKLIESFQFITMVSAHIDNYKRQILQLCIGIQHFYEVVGNELWK